MDYVKDDYNAYVNHAAPRIAPLFKYRLCQAVFQSNNKLHNHLRDTDYHRKSTPHSLIIKASDVASSNIASSSVASPVTTQTATATPQLIIAESLIKQAPPGHAFRGWHYTIAKAHIAGSTEAEPTCLDSGCSITMINKTFLKRVAPQAKIYHISKIKINGIGPAVHNSSAYI